MFVLKFIAVMFSMILADVCWTMYFIEVDRRKPIPAGLWGASIILFGAFTTVEYVADHRYLVAAFIGSFIGTAGTVYYKKKKRMEQIKEFSYPEPSTTIKADSPVDSVVTSVINQFVQRSQVGQKKYGTNLDRKDLTTLEWIEHAKQELMDGILYLEKLKQELSAKS